MPRPENTREFIAQVLSEVRWKQAHRSIARELSDHVEDQSRAFAAEGMGEAEAERAAIRDMGDPLTLGTAFDAAYRPRPTWQMLLPMGVLLVAALLLHLLLYAPMEHYEAYAGETVYKEIMSLLVGGLLFTIAYFMNFKWLARLGIPLYLILLLALWRVSTSVLQFGNRFIYLWNIYHAFLLYPMLVLPVATAGLCWTLRKLGVWGVLLCSALALLPMVIDVSYYERSLLLCILVCFAVMLAAIFLGMFRGKKWLLLLALVLPLAACCVFVFPHKSFLWHSFQYGFINNPESEEVQQML